MPNIQFKDISNEDLNIICVDPGRRQGLEEQIITYVVPFRDDEPIEHTDTYKPYTRPMIFGIKKGVGTLTDLLSWLNGYGKLYTSVDPGGYFKAHVVSYKPVIRHSKNYDYVQVNFKISPGFFYLGSGDTPIPLGAPGSINNPGTHKAKPYIKITGTGDIDLDVNGRVCSFTGLTDYIEIDSETEYAYRDTVNVGDQMEGEFPYFDVGVNNIAWTGNVTNLQIIPRWREK